VGDRAAHLAVGALDVDVDPLVIARRVGELVDPVLANLDPVGDPDLLPHEAGQILHFDGVHPAPPFSL
jgi:hypothetical protein